MVYFIYNILLIILLIFTFPFWIFKVLTKEKHRKGFWEKLGIGEGPVLREVEGVRVGFSNEISIHIHAVSVGEVIAATPFIKELRQRHPEIRLILTTVPPTGNDVARKRLPEVDHIL